MRAAILAVGTELLGEDRSESNSLRLSRVLADHGVELAIKVAVGDREEEIAGEVARLAARHELVLVTGGLGPTADDVTREGVARALGRELAHDAGLERALRERYAALGRRMPEANRKQADLVAGAVALPNRHGTAPGQRIGAEAATLFLLPGVPHELEAMVDAELRPWLLARTGGEVRERITVRTAGLPESEVDERLAPVYERFPRDQITVLGSAGEVRVRLTAGGAAEPRRAFLAALLGAVRAALGEAIYAATASATLEGVVGARLWARGATLAVAESCTGGLVTERLTRVPGA
ncbi:MAG TPA: molybdopterin-binding protein, partial [Thermoanaerobaculia bacterium]|nr:molybdopterin-binding protein [Thermoanaerobaculia bacterium]